MQLLVIFLIIDIEVDLRWKKLRKLNLGNKCQLQNHTPQVKKNIRGQRAEFMVFIKHQCDQTKVEDSGRICPYTIRGEIGPKFQYSNLKTGEEIRHR